MYSRDTELRHLQPNDVYKLGVILDDNHCWKKLMEIIPKEINTHISSADGSLNWELVTASAGLKYTNDHIRLIESAIDRPGESRLFSQILFEEWGTSGRRHERPTVGVLLQLLVQAELFRAADFVATMLLNEPPPARPLNGPAARIDISLSDDIFNDIEELVNDSSFYPGTMTLNENANYATSLANINKDYYTKYQQLDKHVEAIGVTLTSNSINDNVAPKPPPRMLRYARQQQQQQQQKTVSEATTAEANSYSERYDQAMRQSQQPQQQMQQQQGVTNDSTQSLDNALTSQNLPKFSTLMSRDNERIASPTITTTTDASASSYLSEAPIPMISLLAANSMSARSNEITESTTESTYSDSMIVMSMSESEVLPVISALNLNGEGEHSLNSLSAAASPNRSKRLHSESGSSRSSSLSDDSINEEHLPPIATTDNAVDVGEASALPTGLGDAEGDYDDNSVPNLSIFEQQSSNNDSSLTTVTGTSGDNSFELSMNDCSSASNEDNIPCLSALKQ